MDRRAILGAIGLPILVLLAGWPPLRANTSRAAGRTVDRLTSTGAPPAPPITSDDEHADAIAPVLAPRTPVLYHDDSRPTTNLREARYVLSEGRVFVLDGVPRRDHDEPMLRIRAVDGGQDIPFVLRSALTPYRSAPGDGQLEITFPAPAIFRPSIEVHGAWVAGRAVDATSVSRVAAGTVTVQVPVRVTDLRAPDGTPRPVSVLVEGALLLRSYDRVDPDALTNPSRHPPGDPLAELASLSVGRDCRDDDEHAKLVRAARSAASATPDGYQQVVAVNSFVLSRLRYLESPLRRWPGQILDEGVGDCDDYSALTVALLRALAIPCRLMRGFLYEFATVAPHTWVEVALPRTDGGTHWFICDPTLVEPGTTDEDSDVGVQLRKRAYLYPARPVVAPSGLGVHHVTDILFNVAGPDGDDPSTPAAIEAYVLQVSQGVAGHFTVLADELSRSSVLLRRELPLSAGSSYVIGERTISQGRSALRTVLESEERIAVELAATADGVDLGDSDEREILEALRASYLHLGWLLFHGLPAYHCLELAYTRDPHSDHLERVRLVFNRYLIQAHLRPIRKRLRKEGVWSDEEAALVENLHRTSGGTNLYFLQELARQRAAGSTLAP